MLPAATSPHPAPAPHPAPVTLNAVLGGGAHQTNTQTKIYTTHYHQNDEQDMRGTASPKVWEAVFVSHQAASRDTRSLYHRADNEVDYTNRSKSVHLTPRDAGVQHLSSGQHYSSTPVVPQYSRQDPLMHNCSVSPSPQTSANGSLNASHASPMHIQHCHAQSLALFPMHNIVAPPHQMPMSSHMRSNGNGHTSVSAQGLGWWEGDELWYHYPQLSHVCIEGRGEIWNDGSMHTNNVTHTAHTGTTSRAAAADTARSHRVWMSVDRPPSLTQDYNYDSYDNAQVNTPTNPLRKSTTGTFAEEMRSWARSEIGEYIESYSPAPPPLKTPQKARAPSYFILQ